MDKKGQALVEFIIIMPIFLMMIMGIVDIGNILYNKNVLESKLDNVVSMYEDNYSYDDIVNKIGDEFELSITNNNQEYVDIVVIKEINIITPGLNLVFNNPYQVKAKRVVYYE